MGNITLLCPLYLSSDILFFPGELDFEQQDTSELLEFLLNSSDDEDSVDMELCNPQPDSEALLMAGFQNQHGQHHPNETTTIK